MVERSPRTLMDAATRRSQRRGRRGTVLAVETLRVGWSVASLVLSAALLALWWSGHLLLSLR